MLLENVSSLSEEDLKEFEVSVEDTGAVEKQETPEKETEQKEKEDNPSKPFSTIKPGTLDEDFLKEEEEPTTSKEKEPKTPKSSKKEEKSNLPDLDYNAVYKRNVEKGLWVSVTDEEGNEVEIEDEETFQKLMDWQTQNAAELVLKEREQEFGEQYQTLVRHLKNGGTIDQLAQTYEQEKDIESYDTDNIEDAESIIEAYYDSLDWDKSDIKDQIEAQKDKGEDSFKAFAAKRKADLVKSISSERQQIIEQQEIHAKRLKDSQEKYNKEFKAAIHTQEVPEREKKELEKFYYDYKHQLQNGKASDFYVKFEEIKQDPAKWLKMVQFVKDFDQFEKKSTTEKKVKTSIFKTFREGEVITKKDTQTPEAVKTDKAKAPTTFKRMFSN